MNIIDGEFLKTILLTRVTSEKGVMITIQREKHQYVGHSYIMVRSIRTAPSHSATKTYVTKASSDAGAGSTVRIVLGDGKHKKTHENDIINEQTQFKSHVLFEHITPYTHNIDHSKVGAVPKNKRDSALSSSCLLYTSRCV